MNSKQRIKKLAQAWRKKNWISIQERERLYYLRNRTARLDAHKTRHDGLRLEVLLHYCKGKLHCQCPGCSRTQFCFLQMDHIEGNGGKHRTKKGFKMSGDRLWRWLKKRGYPKNFQVLCSCCNFAKRNRSKCPMHGKKH